MCLLQLALLFGSHSLLGTSAALLTCTVATDRPVLFSAGNVDCGPWQAPLYIVVVALGLLAIVPVVHGSWTQYKQQKMLDDDDDGLRQQSSSAPLLGADTIEARNSKRFLGLKTGISGVFLYGMNRPYFAMFWYWPGILAVQRLSIVMIATLSFDNILITGSLHTIVAMVFMLLQLKFEPYVCHLLLLV